MYGVSDGKALVIGLSPSRMKVINTVVAPSLIKSKSDDKFQLEQHGYSAAVRVSHTSRTGV